MIMFKKDSIDLEINFILLRFLMMKSYLHKFEIKTEETELTSKTFEFEEVGEVKETIKLKFVRCTSKADQIITHRLLKRSASKFFRKIYAYPLKAKDLNLLFKQKKTHTNYTKDG